MIKLLSHYYAKRVTALDNKIVRVTIGVGGKTPKVFNRTNALVDNIEKAEGYQYIDSKTQSLIYFNEKKLKDRIDEFVEKFDFSQHVIWPSKLDFDKSINYKQVYSYRTFDRITKLFFDHNKYHLWRDPQILYQIRCNMSVTIINIMYALDQNKSLTKEILNMLCERAQNNSDFCMSISELPEAIVNAENFEFLAFASIHSDIKPIVGMLTVLHRANPDLITKENRELLSSCKDVGHIKQARKVVSELANQNFLSDANFKLVMSRAKHGKIIAAEIYDINKKDSQFLNDAKVKLIISRGFQACHLHHNFLKICEINSIFLNDESFLTMAACDSHANLLNVLAVLMQANSSLVNNENFKALASCGNHLIHIYQALEIIDCLDKSLVNSETLNLLMKCSPGNTYISYMVRELAEANSQLVNREVIRLLLEENKSYKPRPILLAVFGLFKHNNDLANTENFKIIMMNPLMAEQVATGLIALYEACMQIASPLKALETQRLFASTPILITAVEKLQKRLLGDSTVVFIQKELDALHDWKMDAKSNNVITTDLLPKASQVEDSKDFKLL